MTHQYSDKTQAASGEAAFMLSSPSRCGTGALLLRAFAEHRLLLRNQMCHACAASEHGECPHRIMLPYVPISHDAKYFFCSAVSVSMSTPIPASFSLAISLSISAGTG